MWAQRRGRPRHAAPGAHTASAPEFVPLTGLVTSKSSGTYSLCPRSRGDWNKAPRCLLFTLAGSRQCADCRPQAKDKQRVCSWLPGSPNLLPKGGLRSEGDLKGGWSAGHIRGSGSGRAPSPHRLQGGTAGIQEGVWHNSDISFRVSFLISNIYCLEMFVSLGNLQLHLLPPAPDPSSCRRSVTVLVTPTWDPDPRPASHTGPPHPSSLTSRPWPRTSSPVIMLHMNHFLMFGLIHTDSLNNKNKSANSITIWKSLS